MGEQELYLEGFCISFWKIYCNVFRSILRKIKKGNDNQIKSWIRDQYEHPVESLHTLDEVLKWFDDNNIEFINSIPKCDDENNEEFLFEKTHKGTFLSLLF